MQGGRASFIFFILIHVSKMNQSNIRRIFIDHSVEFSTYLLLVRSCSLSFKTEKRKQKSSKNHIADDYASVEQAIIYSSQLLRKG